ncbi:MAG: hypothetical protein ABI882_19550, partial [Acidobacteriota bacterium]
MRGFLKTCFCGSANLRTSIAALCLSATLVLPYFSAAARAIQVPDITVKADFDGKTVRPDQPIELTLNRPLQPAEGRLGIVIGSTDLTDLFVIAGTNLTYAPRPVPFTIGETELTVYLIDSKDEWNEIAKFALRVGTKGETDAATVAISKDEPAGAAQPSETKAEEARTDTQPADSAPAAAATQTQAEPVKRRFGFD